MFKHFSLNVPIRKLAVKRIQEREDSVRVVIEDPFSFKFSLEFEDVEAIDVLQDALEEASAALTSLKKDIRKKRTKESKEWLKNHQKKQK